MKLIETGISGLVVLQPNVWKDDRGYFFESYNAQTFSSLGLDLNFKQDNQSFSQKGILRGLHYQKGAFAQGKLVRVIQGSVYDVAVDLRKESPTYGKHFGIMLSESNFTMMYVPPGFAHGFSVLEDNTLFLYKCTEVYNKESEGGIIWNDPDLGIDWKVENPILSDKDQLLPTLKHFISPF